jgi:hypothetical protein
MLLIEKIARKLATWKTLMLNKIERLILIKTVLLAIAVHHIVSLDLPSRVVAYINSRMLISMAWIPGSKSRSLPGGLAVCKPLNLGRARNPQP